jgi:gas vesicle protein
MAQRDDAAKLLWFVAGAAVGAGIALLYAPQSGRDTRRIIKKKTREGGEALADSGRDLMDKGRDLYEKGRRVADDAAELFERGRRLVEG